MLAEAAAKANAQTCLEIVQSLVENTEALLFKQ